MIIDGQVDPTLARCWKILRGCALPRKVERAGASVGYVDQLLSELSVSEDIINGGSFASSP